MSSKSHASVALLAMSLALGSGLAVFLGACFNPTRPELLQCSSDGKCPGSRVCGAGNVCSAAAGDGDSGPLGNSDARAVAVDAAPDIDAVPVECINNEDCASPPDLCFTAGTCNMDLNLCSFPKVSCPANETCATHSCNPDSGQCETTNSNEAATCAAQSCTDFGSCAYDDANDCDENGTRSRTCTDFVCTSGSCVGNASTDNDTCSRSTAGIDCLGGTTCGMYAACVYTGGVCDESGTETRMCTDRTCSNEICTAVDRDEMQNCSRNTDGNTCDFENCGGSGGPGGIQEICCANGGCTDTCGICDQF